MFVTVNIAMTFRWSCVLTRCAPTGQLVRPIFSESRVWPKKLTVTEKKAIERRWRDEVNQRKSDVEKEKCYVLAMFPYPSGNLHIGHVRVYTISDVIARFYRMNGKTVIHPIGWDAFGLPAENAAIERQQHSEEWTKSNIASMKKQLQDLNYSFDWDREISTCDPKYYKWTQYLFLKMFEKGLAYQKYASVNWDPVDLTVLANEQVDANGRSWRSGAKVEKKSLRQWFLRATAFSKSLSDGLLDPALVNWQAVKKVQQHWIGDCNGCHFTFKLVGSVKALEDISVWTNTPEAIFGATFIAVSREHKLATDYLSQLNGEIEHQLPVMAIHPFTRRKLPIFVSESVPYPESCNSYLGIPGVCLEAEVFAELHDLNVIAIYDQATGDLNDVVLINSDEFSGLNVSAARNQICARAKELGIGGDMTSSKLQDWLISRQRYWGTPIPIIHCARCKAVPVAYEDLPVTLPKIEMTGSGSISLKSNETWIKTTCPKCGGPAERETDTMDTFVDSSWYFLRFLDPENADEPFRVDAVNRLMPVDIYIGGMEHAFLHLYYARFVSHFYHSLGLIEHKEPFKRLLVQGIVKGRTFRSKETGKYLRPGEVEAKGQQFIERSSRSSVSVSWQKMSKSKHNGVDPQDVTEEYGIDTARLFILAGVAPSTDRNWSSDLFPGVLNWQQKLWDLVTTLRSAREKSSEPRQALSESELIEWESRLFEDRNYCIKRVNFGFVSAYAFNGAISYLQALTKSLLNVPAAVVCHSHEYEKSLADLFRLLSPMAPHFASELWLGMTTAPGRLTDYLSWEENVTVQPWPDVDQHYKLDLEIKDSSLEEKSIVHCMKLPRYELDRLCAETALDLAMNCAEVKSYLNGRALPKSSFSLSPGLCAELTLHLPFSRKSKKHSGAETSS